MNGVTQVADHMFEIGGMGASTPQAPAESDAPTVRAARGKVATPAPTKATDVRALLAQLRSRLRDVKREIRAKKALEQERDQLQRLIRAATTELDNVRRLRAAG